MIILSRTDVVLLAWGVVSCRLGHRPGGSLIFEDSRVVIVTWSRSPRHDERISQVFSDDTSDVRVDFLLWFISARPWYFAASHYDYESVLMASLDPNP